MVDLRNLRRRAHTQVLTVEPAGEDVRYSRLAGSQTVSQYDGSGAVVKLDPSSVRDARMRREGPAAVVRGTARVAGTAVQLVVQFGHSTRTWAVEVIFNGRAVTDRYALLDAAGA